MKQLKEMLRDLTELLQLRAADPDVKRKVDFNMGDLKELGVNEDDFYYLLRTLERQGIIEKDSITINDSDDYIPELDEVWPGPFTVQASESFLDTINEGPFDNEGMLTVNKKKILINRGNQFILATVVFSSPDCEIPFNTLIDEFSPRDKISNDDDKMVYSAVREINNKVLKETGLRKLLIFKNKHVLVNPVHKDKLW